MWKEHEAYPSQLMMMKDALLGHSRCGEEVFSRNIVASRWLVTLGVLPTSGCILE